jgi:hypothetical protein
MPLRRHFPTSDGTPLAPVTPDVLVASSHCETSANLKGRGTEVEETHHPKRADTQRGEHTEGATKPQSYADATSTDHKEAPPAIDDLAKDLWVAVETYRIGVDAKEREA